MVHDLGPGELRRSMERARLFLVELTPFSSNNIKQTGHAILHIDNHNDD